MTQIAKNRLRRSIVLLFAVYALGVLIIMAMSGSPDQALWWLMTALFFAWAVAPLATAVFIMLRQTSMTILVVSLGLMGLAVVSGMYIYIDAMFGNNTSSTSGLIFLFLPAYQWVFPLVILIAVASLLRRRQQDD